MKKSLFFVTALLALASCTSDEFTGDKALGEANGKAPISFGFDMQNATRAESTGATAAEKLSNQFVVYAEKDENGAAAPAEGKLVIQNYQVKWTAGSENSTTSNTEGWEYVGFASQFPTQVTPVSTEVQTIKYWDYSASTYTFTAISALPADLTGGKMTIAKTTTGTAPASKYGKGYVVTISDASADLSKLYFADRVEIAASNGTDRHADNAYGGNVTFKFRNAMSQVRVGMYETIPGYAISNVKFYQDNGTTEQTNSSSAKAFGAIVPNIPATGFTGTLTVTYADNTTSIENQPIVTAARTSGTTETNLVLGTNIQTVSTTNLLGTTSTAPTWDTDGGTYTSVFPQASNTTNMVLKVDYTLYNATTHETIEVKGATATVPGKYVAWKPNFKYTYLFKISNETNGSTGQGVAGLYPITFDAVIVEAEDGQAEYITTVSDPSITTFGTVTAAGKTTYVKDGGEYVAGSNVYATIVDNGSVIDPDGKYNVYTVASSDATNFPITEASVAESLAEISAKTHVVTCTVYAGTKSLENQLPGEDGKTITLSAGKAIKLTALGVGTYAVEYVKSARTYKGEAVTYDTQAQYDAAFAKVNLFTDAACTTAAVAGSWSDSNKTFYKQVVDDKGVYAYKVIVVQ